MDEHNITKKKTHWLVRLLALLVTVALVAGAIFLVANREMLNLDVWKRYITYRTLERSDSGQAEAFSYSASASDVLTAFGSDLLVCSEGGIRLYSGSGVCYVEDSAMLEDPAAEVCGDTAAVWSVGGDTVWVYRDRTQYGVLTGLEGQLLSVRLNSEGWLAVAAREGSYKAVITIYDDELNRRMAFRLSSAFVTDAVVTDDCASLAVVSIGQNGTAFESTLTFYALPSTQDSGVSQDLTVTATHSLGNNVILELDGGADIWCVGDYGVSVWDGKEVGSWSFTDRYLKSYAVSDDFAAMLIGKYQTGSQAELYTIDAHGTPSIERVINEQVLSLSAAGRYVAVLTADRLDIYTQDLEIYATLKGTDGAQTVLMRDDGTALLVGGGTASLYIP